jgi:hypothetical protein
MPLYRPKSQVRLWDSKWAWKDSPLGNRNRQPKGTHHPGSPAYPAPSQAA